jgi:hypothetical protein
MDYAMFIRHRMKQYVAALSASNSRYGTADIARLLAAQPFEVDVPVHVERKRLGHRCVYREIPRGLDN